MSSPALSTPTTPAAKAGLWEDFVDIFYAPSSVFARRETANAFVPIAVVTLLIGIIGIFTMDATSLIMDAETRRQMASNPAMAQLTPEQLQGMRTFQTYAAAAGAFVIIPFTILVIGLILWLAGKVVDAKQTIGAALMVAAYAYVPRVVEAALGGVQARLMDPSMIDGAYRLRFSPARFLDPDATSAVTIAALGRIDLFVIWSTALLAIGLAVTGKISRGKAAIGALIVWAVTSLLMLLGPIMQAR
jgi:hypothetical protein